jgi:hypothetical protein
VHSPSPAVLVAVVLSLLAFACKSGDPAPAGPGLVILPDDGHASILDAIAESTSNIGLTIYEIMDLAPLQQTPPALANGVVQALIDAAHRGVGIRVIVDQGQYGGGSSSQRIHRRPDDGDLCGLTGADGPQRRPGHRRHQGGGPARQHARRLHRCRKRPQRRGRPAGAGQRGDLDERDAGGPREGARPDR